MSQNVPAHKKVQREQGMTLELKLAEDKTPMGNKKPPHLATNRERGWLEVSVIRCPGLCLSSSF
jgi:hypothetical protein